MKVRNAINTSVVEIDENANLHEAARQMDLHEVRVLAVVSGEGDPVGIVTERELATAAQNSNPGTTPVEDVIPTEITGCYEDVEFSEAVQIMLLMRIRHLPVFNRNNRLIGFLSAQPRNHDIH
jgi:CBS domain-containing protein